MKKILAFLLVACCLLGLVSAYAESAALTVDVQDAFGNEKSRDVLFDDDWFDAPSREYNHKLAQLSLVLADAAFRDLDAPLAQSSHYIETFFDQMGFESFSAYGYSEETSIDTISNAIALKHLEDEQGPYVLIAIPVCGQGYKNEWMSNFSVDDGSVHTGFDSAAEKVYNRLLSYIETQGLEGQRLKIWGSGFSRAAAVNNLVADRLLRSDLVEDDNVFFYTFATPSTTTEPTAWPQIFNICRSFDPVPHIPFDEWGYGKHGITYYITSRETDPAYASKVPAAQAAYEEMIGSSDGFGALLERNWFVGKALNTLLSIIPDPSLYTATLQDAIIAAVGTKGDVFDKLAAFEGELEEINQDLPESSIQAIRELIELASAGASDTLNLISGTGGTSVWYDLLTSGSALASEHRPETYFAWVFSTDDPSELYNEYNTYNKLIYSGSVSLTITTDGEPLDIHDLSVVQLLDQTFINLPGGREYTITLTAEKEALCQISAGTALVQGITSTLYTCNPLTLYEGETLVLTIPEDGLEPTLILGSDTEVSLYAGDQNSVTTGTSNRSRLSALISSGLSIVPWCLFSFVMIFYVLTSLINRLVRSKVDDRYPPRIAGKIVLILCALLAAASAGACAYQTFTAMTNHVVLTNHNLQRASQLLGWGQDAYLISKFIIYSVVTLLCIRSINHSLSRIRLVRISFMLILVNITTVLAGASYLTLTALEILPFTVPVSSLIGVALVHSKQEEIRKIRRKWLPVSRVIMMTLMIFFVRQIYIYLFEDTTTVAVILKAISGIPVMLMGFDMWRRRRSVRNKMTAIALLLYFMANTVINVSMITGVALYAVGHVLLAYGYAAERKPGRVQGIVWVILLLACEAELFLVPFGLDLSVQICTAVYIATLMGVLVTAFPISSQLRSGTILFMLANQLLGLTLMGYNNFAIESIELLLYYVAVIIMTPDRAALDEPEKT